VPRGNGLHHQVSLLPNLHTVQIHFKFKGYYDAKSDALVRNCLKGYIYPQIRNLSISSAADPFMHVCPKLKVLKPYIVKYLSVSSDMLDYVPELEVLGHICMSAETLKGTGAFLSHFYLLCSQIRFPALVKQLPKLRDLTISEIIFDDDEVGHSTTFNP